MYKTNKRQNQKPTVVRWWWWRRDSCSACVIGDNQRNDNDIFPDQNSSVRIAVEYLTVAKQQTLTTYSSSGTDWSVQLKSHPSQLECSAACCKHSEEGSQGICMSYRGTLLLSFNFLPFDLKYSFGTSGRKKETFAAMQSSSYSPPHAAGFTTLSDGRYLCSLQCMKIFGLFHVTASYGFRGNINLRNLMRSI